MASIFLSYRREDTAGYAGRISDWLGREFGRNQVFMDMEDIVPGQDFVQAIDARIAGCAALVEVIGPRWLDVLRARAGDPQDFVRHEVELALKRGITVIPVLVGGARMPDVGDLPESIAVLARHQALQLHDERFDDDIRVLLEALRSAVGSQSDLSGSWIAEMRKDGHQFRIRLDLQAAGERLIGTVNYPTGQALIREGTISGSKVNFTTIHTPQFSNEPATINFYGEFTEGELRLVSADDNGIARGTAYRAEQHGA